MKHLIYLFRYTFIICVLAFHSGKINAQTDSVMLKSMDSVQISLLTCGPGDNAYSLYGHTAIRFNDIGRGQDIVINYGMFSFQKDYFVLRFVFGITDYEMGIDDFHNFINYYSAHNRWVYEQVINLSREEKWAITQAIDINYLPQNRVYRYNYFDDNCSTRARDLIVKHIRGTVLYPEHPDIAVSHRDMIHQWTKNHRWSRFGNDLLLGVKADKNTTTTQQQFLPDTLRQHFQQAIVITPQRIQQPLVAKSHYLVEPSSSLKQSSFFTPHMVMLLFLALTLAVCAIEWFTKHTLWLYDLMVLIVSGGVGLVLTAMIFSQHPTVSLNFQLLFLTPLSLVFLYPTIKKIRQKQVHFYLKLWVGLIIICLLLSFFQHYAEGISIMALSLLIRYASIMLRFSKTKSICNNE